MDIRFGKSPLLGALSFEYQTGHYGFGFGLPGHLAASYYDSPGDDSVFYTVGIANYDCDEFSDYEYGYYFNRWEYYGVDFGGGYRWFWQPRWNITTSASLHYSEVIYRNDYTSRALEKQEYGLALAVGYTF